MSLLDSLKEPLLSDPLRDVTRRERKALLTLCLLSLALTWGGLFPESVDAYGFKITELETTNLLILLAAVVAFLLIGFIVFAYTDLKLRESFVMAVHEAAGGPAQEAMEQLKRLSGASPDEVNALLRDPQFQAASRISNQSRVARKILRASRLRIWYEIYLPVLVGGSTLIVLVVEAGGLPSAPVLIALASITATATAVLGLQSTRSRRWLREKYSQLLMWRVKRVTAKLKRLGPDHPRSEQLKEKARRLLRRYAAVLSGRADATPPDDAR